MYTKLEEPPKSKRLPNGPNQHTALLCCAGLQSLLSASLYISSPFFSASRISHSTLIFHALSLPRYLRVAALQISSRPSICLPCISWNSISTQMASFTAATARISSVSCNLKHTQVTSLPNINFCLFLHCDSMFCESRDCDVWLIPWDIRKCAWSVNCKSLCYCGGKYCPVLHWNLNQDYFWSACLHACMKSFGIIWWKFDKFYE